MVVEGKGCWREEVLKGGEGLLRGGVGGLLLYFIGFCGVILGGLESGLTLYSIMYLDCVFFQVFFENYFSTEIYGNLFWACV